MKLYAIRNVILGLLVGTGGISYAMEDPQSGNNGNAGNVPENLLKFTKIETPYKSFGIKPADVKFELEFLTPEDGDNLDVLKKFKGTVTFTNNTQEDFEITAGSRIFSTSPIKSVKIYHSDQDTQLVYTIGNDNIRGIALKLENSDFEPYFKLVLRQPAGKTGGGFAGKFAKAFKYATTKSGIPYDSLVTEEDIIEKKVEMEKEPMGFMIRRELLAYYSPEQIQTIYDLLKAKRTEKNVDFGKASETVEAFLESITRWVKNEDKLYKVLENLVEENEEKKQRQLALAKKIEEGHIKKQKKKWEIRPIKRPNPQNKPAITEEERQKIIEKWDVILQQEREQKKEPKELNPLQKKLKEIEEQENQPPDEKSKKRKETDAAFKKALAEQQKKK